MQCPSIWERIPHIFFVRLFPGYLLASISFSISFVVAVACVVLAPFAPCLYLYDPFRFNGCKWNILFVLPLLFRSIFVLCSLYGRLSNGCICPIRFNSLRCISLGKPTGILQTRKSDFLLVKWINVVLFVFGYVLVLLNTIIYIIRQRILQISQAMPFWSNFLFIV